MRVKKTLLTLAVVTALSMVMGSGCKTASVARMEPEREAVVEAQPAETRQETAIPERKKSPTPTPTPERENFPDSLGEYYDHLLQAQIYHQQALAEPQNAGMLMAQEIESLRKAITLDSRSGYLRALVAERLLQMNRLEEAKKEAEKAVQLDSTVDLGYRVLGQIYRSEKNYEKAVEMYAQALTLADDNRETLLQLGQVYQEKGDWAEANKVFIETAEAYPPMAPRLYQAVAQNYMLQGDFDKAIEYYERSAKLLPFPYDLQVYKSMGLAYLHRKEYDQAIELFHRVWLLEPTRQGKIDAGMLLADAYSRKGDYQRAADTYRQLIDLYPDHWAARRQLGLIDFYLGNYDEAVEQLSEFFKRAPDDWQVLEHLGLAYVELDQADQAIALLERLCETDHATTQIYVQLSDLYASQDRPDDALRVLKQAIEKGEDQASLYYSLGVMQYERRQTEQAEASLKKALELESKHKGSMLYLGLVYDRMNRLDLLEEVVQKAIAADENFAEAYNLLGYALAERGLRLEEAEQLILKAVSLRPDRGFIIDSLGWVYYQQGRYAEAVPKLEQAALLSGDPPDWLVLDHLGDAYLKVDRVEDAVQTWKKAVESRRTDREDFEREEEIQKIEQKIESNTPVN